MDEFELGLFGMMKEEGRRRGEQTNYIDEQFMLK